VFFFSVVAILTKQISTFPSLVVRREREEKKEWVATQSCLAAFFLPYQHPTDELLLAAFPSTKELVHPANLPQLRFPHFAKDVDRAVAVAELEDDRLLF
jgi:hypothetical protein